MADKLILDNRTEIGFEYLWAQIGSVLCAGRVCNEGRQHQLHTEFGDGIVISSILNDRSERLVITVQASEA